MKDRLIELLLHKSCMTNKCPDVACEKCEYIAVHIGDADKIADYLLDNGVIVPPCKVGDKLYAISKNRIAECICDEISICNEVTISADFKCDYDCKGCPFNVWKQDFHTGEYSCDGEYGICFFSLTDFGKTVFLTREDAENALKGGMTDGNLL